MTTPTTAQPIATLERRLTGHTGWVQSVAVSPDGKWAASGSRDNTVRIWALETGECRAVLTGHTDDVNAVAITPDGKRVLSASDDNTVRVWDVDLVQLRLSSDTTSDR
ncbi:MAG: WD domain-containing protein, G-beta repeat-containing protein [Candidatus Kentron sp. G]|nr:MAG: WD domain-containing protein, G-beta repeat-containing protein [Candidatus Kentron sp. G]VFN00819.1 MAG: WD domain-containing protein, G-beta repeat-containing protein [Candidatus Kentron sp. G]VFN01063.1 MAG: WD domain-containing protein, G-beta repeat-containing protein [Candidatus Kentron sp. G]